MYTQTPHYCLKQERFVKERTCYRNKAHDSRECLKHSSDRMYNFGQTVNSKRPSKRTVKNGNGGGSVPMNWVVYGKTIAV